MFEMFSYDRVLVIKDYVWFAFLIVQTVDVDGVYMAGDGVGIAVDGVDIVSDVVDIALTACI